MSNSLTTLPYSGPPQRGLEPLDFAQNLATQSEPVRWWKAFPCNGAALTGPQGEVTERNGVLYVEQPLGPAVRVWIYRARIRDEAGAGAQFSLTRGRTAIAALRSQLNLVRGDRLLLTARTELARCALAPSGNATDPLAHRFVTAITQVLGANGALDPSLYAVGPDGASVSWTTTSPAAPVCLEYLYTPLYTFLEGQDRPGPLSPSGEEVLRRGFLELE